MNTTGNISIGDMAYPLGMSPSRRKLKGFLLKNNAKIISQSFMELDPDIKTKLNQAVVQIIFNVKISNVDWSQLNLKQCLKNIFLQIDCGIKPQKAIINILKEYNK